MKHPFAAAASLLACALLLAGCATPESRIRKNPALFASFPPEVQAKVQKGEIDVGYTPEMVQMAMDRPDRTYTRQTAGGTTEVWAYTDSYTTTDRQQVTGPFRYRDSYGMFHTVVDSAWVDVQQKHEYDRLRVEFETGKVKAIERINRDR